LLDFLTVSLSQGLLYALLAAGVVVSFKMLDFPDLSVDGTFPLGGAVAAALIVKAHWNPIPSTVVAIAAGCLAGMTTGFVSARLRIGPLLSGILVMTMLYSVNLRIMGGANTSLLRHETVFTALERTPARGVYITSAACIIVSAVTLLLVTLLRSEYGAALRFTGDNPRLVRATGLNDTLYTVTGIGVANALVALSGALVAQRQGFAEVNMGIGMIVVGLASIIIGDAAIPVKKHKIWLTLLAAIVGSIGYQFALGIGLRLGLPASDLKLVTGVLVVAALALGKIRFHVRT
jgi:putative ABC transport system permease protein